MIRNIVLRTICVVLILGLILSSTGISSYADIANESTLAPSLVTQPQYSTLFHNEWVVAKIGQLVYPFLIEPGKYKDPSAILIPHIKKFIKIENTSPEVFNIDDLKELRAGPLLTGFSLPFKGKDSKPYNLIYNLQSGDMSIPTKDGTVYIRIEEEILTTKLPLAQSPIADPAKTSATLLQAKQEAYEKRIPLLQKQLEEEAKTKGGKGVGLERLKALADKIGYGVADTLIFTTQDLFDKYIEANKELVRIGDTIAEHKAEILNLIKEELKGRENMDAAMAVVNGNRMRDYLKSLKIEAAQKYLQNEHVIFDLQYDQYSHLGIALVLQNIQENFIMPEGLLETFYEKMRLMPGDNVLIARSSGKKEDGFYKNLAGIFGSVIIDSRNNAGNAIKRILGEFIIKNWIYVNQKIADDGCAIVIQPYLPFEAGFVGFSSLYGKTVIEVVSGGIEKATGTALNWVENRDKRRPTYGQGAGIGNSVIFELEGDDMEITRTFGFAPAGISYNGHTLDSSSDFWEKHSKRVTFRDGTSFRSPISLEEVKEVKRALRALEEKLGYPVDVEGGFINGKLYLVQARPVIGLAYEERLELPNIDWPQLGPQVLSVGKIDFTGNIALVKYRPDEKQSKVLKKLDNYIYVSENSGFWTTESSAPVFISLEGATRLWHDVLEDYPIIKEKGYCYVAGFLLSPDITEKLEYKIVDGVKVSRQKIRVVSDGLKARLYIVPEAGKGLPAEAKENAEPLEKAVRIAVGLASFGHGTNEVTEVISKSQALGITASNFKQLVTQNEKLSLHHNDIEAFDNKLRQTLYAISDLHRKALAAIRTKALTESQALLLFRQFEKAYESINDCKQLLASLSDKLKSSLLDEENKSLLKLERIFNEFHSMLTDRLYLMAGKISEERFSLNDIFTHFFEDLSLTSRGVFKQYFELRLPQTPIHLKGNRISIISLLCNLADDCFRYAGKFRKNDAKVIIDTKVEGDKVVITISDNGNGMSPEDLKDTWTPFHTTGGTGIGLTEARLIVKDHGGTIDVQSEPGKGTTFTIRLPITLPEAQLTAPTYEVRLTPQSDHRWIAESAKGRYEYGILPLSENTPKELGMQFGAILSELEDPPHIYYSIYSNDKEELKTVLLLHGDEVVGGYVYAIPIAPADDGTLRDISVSQKYRQTGAVDILLEDFAERFLGGDGNSRTRQFNAIIARKSNYAVNGAFNGTIDELRNRLGIRSKVIMAPVAVSPESERIVTGSQGITTKDIHKDPRLERYERIATAIRSGYHRPYGNIYVWCGSCSDFLKGYGAKAGLSDEQSKVLQAIRDNIMKLRDSNDSLNEEIKNSTFETTSDATVEKWETEFVEQYNLVHHMSSSIEIFFEENKMLADNSDKKWAIYFKNLVLKYFDSFKDHCIQQKQEPFPVVDLSKLDCFQEESNRKYFKTEIPAHSFVRANDFLLNVLFDNIIMNAFRHSREARGPKIDITFAKTEDMISVAISDNGNGIPGDKLSKIFDLAYSTTGGGVGLTAAYYIVKDLGGTIDVQSEIGKGTTFTIKLPIADKPVEQIFGEIEQAIPKNEIWSQIRVPIDPEDRLDNIPEQKKIISSNKQLELASGLLYHVRDGLDKVLLNNTISGKIPLTRVGHQWGVSEFNNTSKSPALFVISTAVFNKLKDEGKAVLKLVEEFRSLGIIDPYPEITTPLPLESVEEIWIDMDTYERYKGIVLSPSTDIENALKPKIEHLFITGKIKVIPYLRHTTLDPKTSFKSAFTCIGRYMLAGGLFSKMPLFKEVEQTHQAGQSNNIDVAITPESERIHAVNMQDMLTYIQTQPQAQPTIIVLGTSWIKGYEKGQDLQYDALNPLIVSLRNYCESKRIPFIVDSDDKLLARINEERAKGGRQDAKVIVLAGKDTVTSDEFIPLRNDKEHAFVVGVDNQELTPDSYIRLMEMLTIALSLSADFDISLDNPHITITKDKERNIYIFLPHAEPMSYERLKAIYEVQQFA